MRRLMRWLRNRRGDMAEAAVTLPVVLLATMAMLNLTIAGFASVNAANAANYGARVASVYQADQHGVAMGAANQMISNAPIGDYKVSASGGGTPGSMLAVTVEWEVPNFFKGLMSFFGGNGEDFSGEAVAYFRQEGW